MIIAKLHFQGCGGIDKPVDMDGKEIFEGDILSSDWADFSEFDNYPEKRKNKPTYRVEKHKSGGLCAKGIDIELYLHDFRFNKTRKLNT